MVLLSLDLYFSICFYMRDGINQIQDNKENEAAHSEEDPLSLRRYIYEKDESGTDQPHTEGEYYSQDLFCLF